MHAMNARSPSPRDLFDRLSDDEKVAIDLISQEGLCDACDEDFVAQLHALVPSEGRRGYLRTLAMQLPTCVGDTELDVEAARWAAGRERAAAREREASREREEAQARDRVWLASLTPVARRSVERQRRRRGRVAR